MSLEEWTALVNSHRNWLRQRFGIDDKDRPDPVKLDPKERKLLLLAYDPAASVGESLNALRVVFKNWLLKYPDGHALVKDLESGEVREKIVYRNQGSLMGRWSSVSGTCR